MSKTQKTIEWLRANANAIEAARLAPSGERDRNGNYQDNGMFRADQSGPGWGRWAKMLKSAGIEPDAHRYWSGSLPTPSTSINAGIADWIRENCPAELRTYPLS